MEKWAVVGDVHYVFGCPRKRVDLFHETIKRKLDHICAENDKILFLGDLVERATESIQGISYLWRILSSWVVKGREFYILPGNHDLIRGSLSSLDRTTVGLLIRLGVLKKLEETQVISGIQVDTVGYVKDIRRAQLQGAQHGRDALLLGHCFFESALDPTKSLSRPQIEHKQYKYVVLGHDHAPYKPLDLGVTQILRPGSICRYRAVKYNLERSLYYYQLVINQERIQECTHQLIPAFPASQVFRREVFEQTPQAVFDYAKEVQEILASFTPQAADNSTTLKAVLVANQCPENVLHYLGQIHVDLGIEF